MFKKLAFSLALISTVTMTAMIPSPAHAQTVLHWINRQLHVDDHYDMTHRHPGWRNLNYSDHNCTKSGIIINDQVSLNFGITGGLYSTYRYDQDRRSRNETDHERYSYFSVPNRNINGRNYRRVNVMSNGHHYYAYKRQ